MDARPMAPAKAPPPDSLPPELVDHPQYEVLSELGRGGMGVVYLARHRLSGRREVLKVMNKELLARAGGKERFLREIQSAARLDHPNVVKMYTAMDLGSLMVLAMEYGGTEDLAKLVQTRGPLPIVNACYYAQQAAWGLQHAHEKGMIHRDIKPQNLIVSREGKKHIVKVLDLGLAKLLNEKGDGHDLTGEGRMLGTPDYIAPEQTLDAASADIRADIYSLGCTLYFLLTGGPPFKAASLYALLQAHHTVEAQPLNLARPDMTAELAAVVAKMMAKAPANRYQTPLEVAQALAPFIKSGAKANPTAPPPSASQGNETRAATVATETKVDKAGTAPGAEEKSPFARETMTDRIITAPDSLKRAAKRNPRAAEPPLAGKKKWWIGMGAAACLVLFLMCGLAGLWAAGVFKLKTKDGTIVLENLPADADVTVDGGTVTVKSNDGKIIEIRVDPGKKHRLEVKKEGFKVFGEEVEIDAGGRRTIAVRLEPLTRPTVPEKTTGDDKEKWVSLFNGKDLSGWTVDSGEASRWQVKEGQIVGTGAGSATRGWLVSDKEYTNFVLRLEFQSAAEADGAVGIRVKPGEMQGDLPHHLGIKIVRYANPEYPLVGALYYWPGTWEQPSKPPQLVKEGDWNKLEIRLQGQQLQITVNGQEVQNLSLDKIAEREHSLPGVKRSSGRLGLQQHSGETRFRNIEIKELAPGRP